MEALTVLSFSHSENNPQQFYLDVIGNETTAHTAMLSFEDDSVVTFNGRNVANAAELDDLLAKSIRRYHATRVVLHPRVERYGLSTSAEFTGSPYIAPANPIN